MNLILFLKMQFQREYILKIRNLKVILNCFLLFLMIVIFSPLTLPAGEKMLKIMLPAFIWTALFFSILLSSESFFQNEEQDGVLEQWLISPYPLAGFIFAKIIIHWLLIIIPMLIISPFIAVIFNLTLYEIFILDLYLVASSPAVIFLCALGAAFSVVLKHKGLLMTLLLIPLCIPIMIFASSGISASLLSLPISGYLFLLLAFSFLAVSFLPFTIAAVLRS